MPPRLALYKSLWGVVAEDGGRHTLGSVLAAASAAGFSGVKCSVALAFRLNAGGAFVAALRRHRLAWLPVAFSSGPLWRGWDPFTPGQPCARAADSPAAHVVALAGQLDAALGLGLPLVRVHCHTGHDGFTDAAAEEVFALADEAASARGLRVAHETHRGRCAGSPWLLARLLPKLPSLRLVADYSHFTAACEVAASEHDPALEDALAALAPRVDHIHLRVGDECRPQLAAAELMGGGGGGDNAEEAAFERWWRAVWDAQAARGEGGGDEAFSATPEYGPRPYAAFGEGCDDVEALNARAAERARALHAAWVRALRPGSG